MDELTDLCWAFTSLGFRLSHYQHATMLGVVPMNMTHYCVPCPLLMEWQKSLNSICKRSFSLVQVQCANNAMEHSSVFRRGGRSHFIQKVITFIDPVSIRSLPVTRHLVVFEYSSSGHCPPTSSHKVTRVNMCVNMRVVDTTLGC